MCFVFTIVAISVGLYYLVLPIFKAFCSCCMCCCEEPRIVPIGESLAKLSYSKSMLSTLNGDCSICLSEFKDKETISSLHCNIRHLFHTDCIRTWLLSNPVCPLCKATFNAAEQKKCNKSFYRRLKVLMNKEAFDIEASQTLLS